VTLSIVAMLVGWLATLILHRDLDSLSLLDLGIGVTGTALVGGLLAPYFGISTSGEYGLSLSGTFVSWLGAVTLLALVNLARHGHIVCRRRGPRRDEIPHMPMDRRPALPDHAEPRRGRRDRRALHSDGRRGRVVRPGCSYRSDVHR